MSRARLLVVGMHLHRERLLSVEELEQQRKLMLRMVAAEECRAVLRHQFVQCLAGERSIGDDALVDAVVDDFPALGVGVGVADRFAEIGSRGGGRPRRTLGESVEMEAWREATYFFIDIHGEWQVRRAARVVRGTRPNYDRVDR